MAAGDVQELLDDLAATLGAPLALEDVDQRLLAYTAYAPRPEAVDAVRLASILGRRATGEVRAWFEQWGILDAAGPLRMPAGREVGALARWCVPVRFRTTLLGYVWVLDDGRLERADLAPAEEVAAELATTLFRRRLAEQADAELVRLLLLPRNADDDALADAYPHRGPVAVIAIGSADGDDLDRAGLAELATATRRAADAPGAGTIVVGAVGGLVAAIVPLRQLDAAPAHRLATSTLALAARAAGDRLRLAAGIGGVAAGVAGASAAHAEARRALRVAVSIPSLGPVAAWDALGVFRALVLVPADQVSSSVLDDRVRALLDRPELARSAEAFLDLAGDATRAAASLAIHRATLYGRLARIREATGLDLARSGDDRLVAHLGLRLARLAGVGPRTP